MPPRHTYWTIILEGKPTAFRARTREELAPTLRQLQARHPDAVLMWFARGRLWESPELAREASVRRDLRGERRGPEWRPGGAHRDPRDRFKVPRDEKRRRFATRLRRDRVEGRPQEGRPPRRPRERPADPRDRPDPRKPYTPSVGRDPNRAVGPRKPFRPGSGRGPRPGGGRSGFRKPGGGGRRGGGGGSR